MFMKTKGLVLVMALVFLVSMAGCGSQPAENKGSTTAPAVGSSSVAQTEKSKKEPVTITWYGGVQQVSFITTGIQDDPMMNAIKEKTGVTIDHSPSLGVSDVNQKATVLIASDDMPDVMFFGDINIRSAVLKAKAALPLDDLVKTNGPELQKNIGKALEASKLLKSDDTHALYFIPHAVNMSDFTGNALQNGYNIRWDLYKKLGYPQITNVDEFLKLLQDMVKLEPKNKDGKPNYGLGLFFGESWCNHMVEKALGAYKGVVEMTTNVSIDVANDKVVARVTDPNSVFWQGMALYNKAYRMGLLDPESITLKFDSFMNKAKTGRYMAGECNWALGGADAQFVADGTPDKGYAPITFGLSDASSFGTTAGLGDQGNIFISKNCKNPDRVMDVLNYMASDEGARLMFNGPEGLYYDVVNGKPTIKADIIKASTSDGDFIKKYGIGKYGTSIIRDGKDSEGNWLNYFLNPEVLQATMTPVQKDYCAYKKISTVLEDLQKLPNASYDMGLLQSVTVPAGSDIQKAIAKGEENVNNNYAKAIVAKTDEEFNKIRDQVIADALALGYDKEVTYYSQQYEQYKSQLK